MRILTLDNQSYNLNNLPEELEEDLRFSVLDNSDVDNPDFFFNILFKSCEIETRDLFAVDIF